MVTYTFTAFWLRAPPPPTLKKKDNIVLLIIIFIDFIIEF